MQSGIPKFKLLNENKDLDSKNFMNGNQFEILYFKGLQTMAIVSQKYGLRLIKSIGKKHQTI